VVRAAEILETLDAVQHKDQRWLLPANKVFEHLGQITATGPKAPFVYQG